MGDHIEKLNGINVIGKRHYEVARMLKDIPTNSTFILRLVEPVKSGFHCIAPRNGPKSSGKKSFGSGKETLRFKVDGKAAIEEEVNDTIQYTRREASNNILVQLNSTTNQRRLA